MVIAICDDDRLWNRQASEILEEYLKEKNEPAEILCFESGEELLAHKGRPISVLFMDIEFDEDGEESKRSSDKAKGITFAGRVNQVWPECQIVFCTNYLYYALDVYETDHIYYLVKSQLKDRLDSVFTRIHTSKRYEKENLYFQVIGGGLVSIPLKDLIYFERKTRYTQIHTREGIHRIRDKIPDLMNTVPSNFFTRCHNSYLVNMQYIACKTGNAYELSSGQEIPISRKYAGTTRQEFLAWCEIRMR